MSEVPRSHKVEDHPQQPPHQGRHAQALMVPHRREREFFIVNLLVRIHCIIVMIRWTGLAPWSLNSLSQVALHLPRVARSHKVEDHPQHVWFHPPHQGRHAQALMVPHRKCKREFFIDNLLVRIHFIIVMIRWTGRGPSAARLVPAPAPRTPRPSAPGFRLGFRD